ncbi:ribonuclease HII [Alicyclobacillus sp. ALC3]|uniref:ribonuclease HII n=1 Tax=Alicyclobacillus sp. ALC3 TaxID=2796143 RepID=UPI002377E924|nr:ribonuclease HII [Alicyclobacillus sp. ALC3]WDL97369.1 ribonuclease HII [Alicyclobacillus sp. ALC3]
MTAQRQARELAHAQTLWDYERQLIEGHQAVICAGVDEVGRGCLAGPVVAAAVVLGLDWRVLSGVRDSKQLTKARRESLAKVILEQAQAVAIGVASVAEIDQHNILSASRIAMARALEGLAVSPPLALVDGPYPPLFAGTALPSVPVVDGDAKCLSIAAASVIAKVRRDEMMAELAAVHPEYGFERNAGYGTAEHLLALTQVGPSPHHRRSFAPVREHLRVGS